MIIDPSLLKPYFDSRLLLKEKNFKLVTPNAKQFAAIIDLARQSSADAMQPSQPEQ